MLRAYKWPGNVRELFAAIESAAIRADGPRIEANHLPEAVRSALDRDSAVVERYRSLPGGDAERSAIMAALEAAGGSRSRAAEILGMGRTTLWRKLKQYPQ